MNNVRYLRPICVLIASSDARFVNLSRLLLAGEGFLVDAVTRPGRFRERLARGSADVLVLDVSDRPELARTARAVGRSETGVGVVVVDEGAEPDRAFEKWSLQALPAAIEAAYRAGGPRPATPLAARRSRAAVQSL